MDGQAQVKMLDNLSDNPLKIMLSSERHILYFRFFAFKPILFTQIYSYKTHANPHINMPPLLLLLLLHVANKLAPAFNSAFYLHKSAKLKQLSSFSTKLLQVLKHLIFKSLDFCS